MNALKISSKYRQGKTSFSTAQSSVWYCLGLWFAWHTSSVIIAGRSKYPEDLLPESFRWWPRNTRGEFANVGLERNLVLLIVEFIHANYGESQLGIPDVQFNELASTVDIIIHTAWKVDFNHSLEPFEPVHIQGVRNLIDGGIHSSHHPHIVLFSSISSVEDWKSVHQDESVSEKPISSHRVTQKMGYGELKHISECILNFASEKVSVSIVRVGQIAGPILVAGAWNRDEWFPLLVKMSQSLGYLPSYTLDADWIAVDSSAASILEIAYFLGIIDEAWTFNIVNPRSTAWASLLNTVLKRLKPQIQLVELRKWIQVLEQSDRENHASLSKSLPLRSWTSTAPLKTRGWRQAWSIAWRMGSLQAGLSLSLNPWTRTRWISCSPSGLIRYC